MKLAKKAATAASAALAEVAISTTEPAAPPPPPPPVVVYGCITIQPREINGAPNPDFNPCSKALIQLLMLVPGLILQAVAQAIVMLHLLMRCLLFPCGGPTIAKTLDSNMKWWDEHCIKAYAKLMCWSQEDENNCRICN